MLHRSAVDDEAKQFQPRPFMDYNRPPSRTSRPASRNHMVKPSRAVTPTGLGVVTENVPAPPPEALPTSPIRDGLGSLNRWSQSTTSSRSMSDHNGHHRGSSKASIPNYSPRRGNGLGELPEINLPELRASDMFSSDPNGLDLSFTASSQIFQNSAPGTDKRDPYEQPTYQPNNPRSSELSMDGEVDGRQTQKAMLSKALQKANTAVLLDNAANFEGAMEAYTEACQLLQLVMLRSNGGDEEKIKLQEIRDTYMIRITELQRMDLALSVHDTKALPQRPVSEESYDELFASNGGSRIQSQHSSAHSSFGFQPQMDEPKSLPAEPIPPRRQSLRPSTVEEFRNIGLPKTSQSGRSTPASASSNPHYSGQYFEPGENTEQSWLDTIDESGASSPSSANSKASSVYLRRRTSRRLSTGTEAEFDAALDAAVEAAYDEGLEPVLEYNEGTSDDVVANARRNIELAKQRVREAEKEAQAAMQRGRDLQEPQDPLAPVARESVYLDEEAEEEERLLEEMTKGYVMDDFEFGIQSKSALPRESDSSNMSGRTWESSAASNITGTGATLSTLAEDEDVIVGGRSLDPSVLPSEPPNAALPPIPAVSDFPSLPPHRISLTNPPPAGPPPPPPSMGPPPVPGVRARRLSKNNSVDLRIHTRTHSRAESNVSHARTESKLSHTRGESNASGLDYFSIPVGDKPPPPLPKDETSDVSRPSTPGLRATLHPSKRNASIGSLSEHFNLARSRTQEDAEPGLPPLPMSARPMAKIPSAPDGLNKAGSRPFRNRNGSMPNPDIGPGSPVTPWEDSFPR
ncbi:hypothetical protein N7468_005719 [Penicillium chermesinum]|uniref:MIT domain-containing protein n=1 Tax=Penicillium chermesinum TaxID=63820 RepID=A0A9W9TNN5_9EURO|nr:uncharacterized protein N7468_005719 [Penicillium chermesinum]KAJ5232763.1 hypothetical protein N7468_005719 [Penicillium chermesinum]